MSDMVNQPAHYTAGGIECIDALEAATKGLEGIEAACTANAIKYLWRWKRKNGAEDLKKAKWYIDRLLSGIEPPPAPEPYVSPGAQIPADAEGYFSHQCTHCKTIWLDRDLADPCLNCNTPMSKEPDLGAPTYELSAEEENDFNNGMLGAPMPEEPTPETHAEYVHKCEHEDCRRKYFTAATEFADCPNCGRKSRGEWDG